MIDARWIALDENDPQAFHDAYARLAAAQGIDAAPIVLWGRPPAHICLGIHQSQLAELGGDTDVPVARRVLGGGAVWLDEAQICAIMIAPARHWGAPRGWYAKALAPFVECFRHCGLNVDRHDRDLWLAGRKIAGSGAATLGHSAVFASSFMLGFNREAFANAVRCPSQDFRDLLKLGLTHAMTDWAEHAPLPDEIQLRQAFREAVAQTLSWRAHDDVLSTAERKGQVDLPSEDEIPPRRLIRDGVKLKYGTYLTCKTFEDGELTVLTEQRRLVTARVSDSGRLVWQIEDCQLSRHALEQALVRTAGSNHARRWAPRVLQTIASGDDGG